MVLSEIATVERGGKVVALVDVRRAYFYAPARRRVFVELPPEDYQAGDEHTCGAVAIQLVQTRQGDIAGSRVGTSESLCDSMRRGKED